MEFRVKDEGNEGLTILCSSSLIVLQSFNWAVGGQGGSKIDPPALIWNFSRGG